MAKVKRFAKGLLIIAGVYLGWAALVFAAVSFPVSLCWIPLVLVVGYLAYDIGGD